MADAIVGLGKRFFSPLPLLHVVGSMCTSGLAAPLLAISRVGFGGVLVYRPIRDWECHNERNCIHRNRRCREDRILLRQLQDYFGVPRDPPRRFRAPQPRRATELPIVISLDDMDETMPDPEPPQQYPVYDVLDSSDSDLPDIELREVEPLPQLLPAVILPEAIVLLS